MSLCVMIVHAHPDDECFTTAGLLARYRAEGATTVLVIATNGEEGEIVVPEMATPENFARLADIRAGELACSAAALGVSHLETLGYRDSGMAGEPSNQHPDCLHMADREAALARVVALVRRYRPHVLVSYDERGGYGHPDHIVCHELTVAAYDAAGDAARFPAAGAAWEPQKLYYTTFRRSLLLRAWEAMRARGAPTPLDREDFDPETFLPPEERITTAIAVSDYLAQKQQSIACHVSQIRAEHTFRDTPPELVDALFGHEYLIRVGSRVALPAVEDTWEADLFAGLAH